MVDEKEEFTDAESSFRRCIVGFSGIRYTREEYFAGVGTLIADLSSS